MAPQGMCDHQILHTIAQYLTFSQTSKSADLRDSGVLGQYMLTLVARIWTNSNSRPRELKNAAFNFSFGAPALPPQPSSRRTPQPRGPSPQKTPAPRPSTAKSKRTKSTPVALPSTRSAKITSTPAAVLPPDEVDELSPDAPVAINEDELPQLRRVSIPILPLNKAEERPPPSPDRRPPREERGRSRTRKSIVSVSYSLSRSRLDALQEEEENDEEDEAIAGAQDSSETDPITSFTHATPSTQRVSSRRRSKSPGRRRTTTGTFDGGTSAFFKNQAAQSTRREVFDEQEPEPAPVAELTVDEPQSEDELTPEPMKASRKRQSDVEILPDADAESEDEDELSPQQDQTQDDSTVTVRTPLADRSTNTVRSRPPAQDKRPREPEEAEQPIRKKQKAAADQQTTKKKYGGPTIPITIYRRTKLADDDPLGIDPEPMPSMQPADVLSQISTEVINAYINTVPDAVKRSTGGSQSKSSTRKTLRYQMQALQQFRDNLADSLRNITFAQHSFYKFSGEVRKAKKQKRDLREELMARRREREAIEIEIDQVRSEHLKAEREHEKQRQLVDNIESIEQAIRRGREEGAKDSGLSSTVVADAEDVASRLGILKRVKDFNAFLARTAEAL